MTKLDPAGEPSMDEILASIRRIIAEEPPGSRVQPDPPIAARKEPAPPPGELTAASDAKAATSRTEPSFGSAFGPSLFAAPPARQPEPALRPSPTGKREVEAIPLGGGQPEIDTQLADVLGAMRGAPVDTGRAQPTPAPRTETAAMQEPTPATNVQAAIDSLIAPKPDSGFGQQASAHSRPGFTVSRDGFIPPPEKPAPQPASDPFEFSLGPSPFARQTEPAPEPSPAAERPAPSRAAEAFGSLVPSRDMLSIDRSAHAGPSMPMAQPPADTLPGSPASFASAPGSRPQPDFAAMSFKSAPEVSKTAAEPALMAPGGLEPSPVPAPATSMPSLSAASPAAFVPAAAAPQPVSVVNQQRPAGSARPAIRTAPSFGEIATPSTSQASWPPPSEARPAVEPFVGASSAAPSPAPQAAQPPAAAVPAPPFTATMFEAPASAAAAQSAAATGPALEAGAPAAPLGAPNETAATPAPKEAAPSAEVSAIPPASPAPVAAQPDATATLLEQLARPSGAAPVPEPAALPVNALAVEHVEPIIEPAAAAPAQAEQDAGFEDAHEAYAEAGAAIEPATPVTPAATAPAASGVKALVARASDDSQQSGPAAAAPVADDGSNVRTMEDTVADLLRPMLRTWLSENMPRIVERALRKELEESNRPEHKSAAE